MQAQLFRNSAIYTVATFGQKALMFVLLPFYTKYLTPNEYGIVSVVIASSFFWTVFFTLGLDGAIVRFYYNEKYRHHFKAFAGTLIISIFSFSLISLLLLLTIGRGLLELFYSEIPLYPYAYLGLSILLFQPIYNFTLSFLQAKNQALHFTVLSFVYFFLNVALTVLFVIFFEWAAAGYIFSILISYSIACVVGLVMLRNEFAFHFKLQFLKDAIRFSYPFIPHSFLAQAAGDTDKFILNRYIDTAVVGVYQVAYSISYAVDILAQSIGRAFSPLFIQNLEKKTDEHKDEILRSSTSVLFVLFAFSSAAAFFIPDFIAIFFRDEFHAGIYIVPLLTFAFLHSGFYYLYSNPLFFDAGLVKFIPVCTLVSGVCTIGLDFVLIPHMGMPGAALAVFTGRLVLALVACFFADRSDLIRWNYKPAILGYCVSLVFVGAVWWGNNTWLGTPWLLAKIFLLFFNLIVLSFVLWNNPFVFLQTVKKLLLKKAT